MYFGLTNSPPTFQSVMNEIFHNPIRLYVIVYMDNILIYSNNEQEHKAHIKEVLSHIQKHDLYLKQNKCKFHKKEVTFLGYIIGEGTVWADRAKVAGITEWPTPKKVKELQPFLGFGNFYQRFIQEYSGIAKPITTLTSTKEPWRWGPLHQSTFNKLKKRYTKAPVLAMPDEDQPFIVKIDASEYTVGAVLSQ
jgi:Reverse transcriptase (RNA-dependent DNA polymerase)/RNase H-like domain found in reverse transcriptase